MAREEEIRQAASSYRTNDGEGVRGWEEATFEAGARWADEHPLSQWVSVNDRLPEKGEIVIIHCKTYGIISALFDDRWEGEEGTDLYYTGDMALEQDDIDWWMPIPPLPKKGGKE